MEGKDTRNGDAAAQRNFVEIELNNGSKKAK